MDAVIMCAGRGTRLRPITDFTPKPLVPIAGRSSLERTLEVLPPVVDRLILVVGYLADKITEQIGNVSAGRPVAYVQQETLDGTGGALRRAASLIRSDRFIVVNGDDLYAREDLSRLAATERGVLVLKTVLSKEEDSWEVGPSGTLLNLKRVAAGDIGYVNVGAYCLDHSWFATRPVLVPGKSDEWSLPHAIPQLLRANVSVIAVFASWWRPVGTPDELRRAEDELRLPQP